VSATQIRLCPAKSQQFTLPYFIICSTTLNSNTAHRRKQEGINHALKSTSFQPAFVPRGGEYNPKKFDTTADATFKPAQIIFYKSCCHILENEYTSQIHGSSQTGLSRRLKMAEGPRLTSCIAEVELVVSSPAQIATLFYIDVWSPASSTDELNHWNEENLLDRNQATTLLHSVNALTLRSAVPSLRACIYTSTSTTSPSWSTARQR